MTYKQSLGGSGQAAGSRLAHTELFGFPNGVICVWHIWSTTANK